MKGMANKPPYIWPNPAILLNKAGHISNKNNCTIK